MAGLLEGECSPSQLRDQARLSHILNGPGTKNPDRRTTRKNEGNDDEDLQLAKNLPNRDNLQKLYRSNSMKNENPFDAVWILF
jgi:hypothetical protein